jgi:hypothetical protein
MSEMRTHDCEATLTDSEMMDFCREGYLVLEAVVPEDDQQADMRVSAAE